MNRKEINKIKKHIKSRIKTMQPGIIYTIYESGIFFEIKKIKNNLYELACNEMLLIDLIPTRYYTKHNLINTMINEIEKEGENNEL